MALSSGALIGLYEIQTAIGAGGRGGLYRTRGASPARRTAFDCVPTAFQELDNPEGAP